MGCPKGFVVCRDSDFKYVRGVNNFSGQIFLGVNVFCVCVSVCVCVFFFFFLGGGGFKHA